MPAGTNGRDRSLDEHRQEAIIENVRFLLDGGMAIDLACERLGLKRDTVDAAFRRHGMQPPYAKPAMRGCTQCGKSASKEGHSKGSAGGKTGQFCGYDCYVIWRADALAMVDA